MTISYKWLCEYLPFELDPARLSRILTSVGLEVESLKPYEEVKGGMEGLVVGEVLECVPHPDADKLKLTKVTIGSGEPLCIVCGAPNVAAGQKVVVATIGTTLYPVEGEPFKIKKSKIRGQESFGMLCAEDEIGIGQSHAGIIVLPEHLAPGTPAAKHFQPYTDHIIEIGLTPNHMDAMSHIGVARDVVAWVNHHEKQNWSVKLPSVRDFKPEATVPVMPVTVEDAVACPRYAGLVIRGVQTGASPLWMQQRLKAIGVRPISNIVDITNYILHETGQPLHAFDEDKIGGREIRVKCLPQDTPFVTLDGKERKLDATDLMICDATEPACIGGVFGGEHSGISGETRNIFLESAWFNPQYIRKTSLRHGLRTDAASRFEKGVDISNTVNVLKRAALLIKEICGGEMSEITDVYPVPAERKRVAIKYQYLKKLSGKNYHPEAVKNILANLGFEIIKDSMDELSVEAPLFKTDISIPADLVEEVMRIDGLDNVDIPPTISIAPASEEAYEEEKLQEKLANAFTGLGFNEILTNSITNSAFADGETGLVKMLNNLSAEMDVMRPAMLETGLQCVAHNLNRKNNRLRFFEFGRVYRENSVGSYTETRQLAIWITGAKQTGSWNQADAATDLYFLKGVVQFVFNGLGIGNAIEQTATVKHLDSAVEWELNRKPVCTAGEVTPEKLKQFDIRQPVFYAVFNWDELLLHTGNKVVYREVPRFPPVERDIAIVLNSEVPYAQVATAIGNAGVGRLKNIRLFDVFEHEKLGAGKKSMALNLVFVDEEKTLADKETDAMVSKIVKQLEQETGAVLRT
ncbi:MAG: phenylalanine--tRNA ligase subunit beta [Dinghuibacter sp.]|nr:phenylalanine--tRNA ligase subunit beta [Dinghuibacter sp.]